MSDETIHCDGCGCSLKQWDPVGPEEGDPMYIVPKLAARRYFVKLVLAKGKTSFTLGLI